MATMKDYHYILRADSIESLLTRQDNLLKHVRPEAEVVFKRYFLSSPETQSPALPQEDGAVCHIGQKPLDGSAIAVWLYLVEGADVVRSHGRTRVASDGAEQYFAAALLDKGGDSEAQTKGILEKYESELVSQGMTIAQNCIRTWFYCRDIDHRYAGLVKGRRENFEENGLTSTTHYIASTGIAGNSPDRSAFVQMDAWAVKGAFRQRYIYGRSHLSPTYDYGVTFERGVKVDMCGLSHTIISGTASIDNRGNVLHIGDVLAQTYRMLENIEVLLAESGSGWDSVRQALVYLRNEEDYHTVAPVIEEKLKGKPFLITLAPVCRPDWLIEMECIATDW